MRRRYRKRVKAGVGWALLYAIFTTLAEWIGVHGLTATGHLHEHAITEIWWHPFMWAAFFYFGYFVWPFPHGEERQGKLPTTPTDDTRRAFVKQRWLQLRQKARNTGRPLVCPVCHFRFAYRQYDRAAKTCPNCKVPLGLPLYYRVILGIVGLSAAAWTMYWWYEGEGPNGLLYGLPFAMVFALVAQGLVSRVFPPKLEAYSESDTWLKLT